ncbi:MAG: flagellar filament capping protein FliD [Inquilinus sp.]|nr:flagellar filament capping protein FliD [Inquilinus sp.]
MDSITGIGTLGLVNGSATFFGGQSGIDTQALIESLVQAKQLPAVRIESRVTANEAKISAFNDLKSKLTATQTALNGLRNPPGFFGGQDNVFLARSVYLSGGTSVDPTSIVAVAVDGEAAVGNFDLTVNRLAKAEKFTGATAADTAALGYAGTISVGLASADYTATDVIIDAGDSILDIRDKFNAVADATGVSASVIQTSANPAAPNYELVLSGTETGIAIDYSDVAGTLISGGDMAKSPLQTAETAQIVLNGVNVERTGNEIDDLLDGVTFTLLREEPAEKLAVEVGTDLNDVKDKIVEFVNAYNEFRAFVESQQVVGEDGEVGSSAALFGNGTVRTTMDAVATELARSVAGVAGLSTLADIGVTFDNSNRLVVDDVKLDDALLTNLDQVRDIFEFRLSSSSSELQVLDHAGSFDLSGFDLQVNSLAADGSGITVSNVLDSNGSPVSGDANPFTVDGTTLIGKAGTAFEGLKLVYTGAAAGETVSVTGVSQGIADSLYNVLDGLTQIDGAITQETLSLDARNTDLAEDIARIEQRAEDFRLFLIARFAALEQALAASSSLMDQVKATADSLSGDN